MKTTSALVALVVGFSAIVVGRAPARGDDRDHAVEAKPADTPIAPAEEARAAERWKAFREHMEKAGRKDLLPEEPEAAKAPSADAIIGILFRMSSEIAAAHDMLDSEPQDVAGARKRLAKLESNKDPYIGEYATLLRARCDLAEKKHPEAIRGFETVAGSSRNLATPAARRGLAECYRGQGEKTLEVLELRFLIASLPPDRTADRTWAESRLAEIRRDHPGPMQDSVKRMQELSTRLTALSPLTPPEGTNVNTSEGAPVDQKKVEEILLKVAKILEDEAKRCSACSSTACKACKKCGACTATGLCPDGQCKLVASGRGHGQGEGDPRDGKNANPAKRSKAPDGDGKEKLNDPSAKDKDAWGAVNDREVAKALQDLWGKIPPSYRQVVAQYFKDISGLETPAPAEKK